MVWTRREIKRGQRAFNPRGRRRNGTHSIDWFIQMFYFVRMIVWTVQNETVKPWSHHLGFISKNQDRIGRFVNSAKRQCEKLLLRASTFQRLIFSRRTLLSAWVVEWQVWQDFLLTMRGLHVIRMAQHHSRRTNVRLFLLQNLIVLANFLLTAAPRQTRNSMFQNTFPIRRLELTKKKSVKTHH